MYRRALALRPIISRKNIVDEQGGLVAGTQVETVLADTVDSAVLANTNEVETGSTINGIFLNVQVQSSSEAALPNVYMFVAKNPGNNITMPQGNATGASDNKRFIIHTEMAMASKSTGSRVPITLFKGVIALPRGIRKFRPDDRLAVHLLSPGVNQDYCVQCIYKWFK